MTTMSIPRDYWQSPSLHTMPSSQPCPQMPQFRLSLFVSTHRFPHRTWPAVQMHSPRMQEPFVHSIPHPPQCSMSDF
jgi:hypothetical protein